FLLDFPLDGSRRDRDGDKAGGGEGARALAQLLTLMDGFHGAGGSSHVIVVGATNRCVGI
ncbi:unnamed protein product, partial [Scytosiphon promiscuus]